MNMPGFTAERSLGKTAESYFMGPVPVSTNGRTNIRPQTPDPDCCDFCHPELTYCLSESGGPVGLGDELGVDQQDPGPGGEAIPGAVLGLEASGDVGRVRGVERREQALLLQAERVEDLVVPEQVAPRPRGLGEDRLRQ